MKKLTIILFSLIFVFSVFVNAENEIDYNDVERTQYNSIEDYLEITGNEIKEFDEAPLLQNKVSEGELPSVDDRLPSEPLVVKPISEIGQYGGEWVKYQTTPGFLTSVVYDPFLRFSADAFNVEPNLAKSWEASEEHSTFTFKIRDGLKWSDGEPFTVDDIIYWDEHVINNEELNPSIPGWYKIDGEAPEVTKIDDKTVKFDFKSSYPLFLQELATAGQHIFQPKHYLSKFHPAFVSEDELDQKLEEAGYDDWASYYEDRADELMNPDLPVMGAWKIAKPNWDDAAIFERNPYYWKVDPEGNQLPYIDKVRWEYAADWEVAKLNLLEGEGHFHELGMRLDDYPLFREMEDETGMEYLLYDYATHPLGFMLNHTVEDPVLRDIFNDIRFKKALSHAVDREELNELYFLGLLDPINNAPNVPGDPWAKEEFWKTAVEFDIERANELLDDMGLEWDKNKKWRLRPDGEKLDIVLMTREPQEWVDISNTLPQWFEKIGIDLHVDVVAHELFITREEGNEFEALTKSARAMDPDYSMAGWGPEWLTWHQTDGDSGKEPSADVKEYLNLIDKYPTVPESDKRIEIGEEITRLCVDNLWMIGVSHKGFPLRTIRNKNFKNIPPEDILTKWDFGLTAYRHSEQYFIDE